MTAKLSPELAHKPPELKTKQDKTLSCCWTKGQLLLFPEQLLWLQLPPPYSRQIGLPGVVRVDVAFLLADLISFSEKNKLSLLAPWMQGVVCPSKHLTCLFLLHVSPSLNWEAVRGAVIPFTVPQHFNVIYIFLVQSIVVRCSYCAWVVPFLTYRTSITLGRFQPGNKAVSLHRGLLSHQILTGFIPLTSRNLKKQTQKL